MPSLRSERVPRYAVKLAYDGTRFHGSQAQPDLRTVQSELATALAKLGTDEPDLRFAGRTDAGVSARGNVVALRTDFDAARLLQALTRNMEDAWAWALAEVDEAFDPRLARERAYRYHLRSDVDAKAFQEALRVFVGTHDFTAFARLEPGKRPMRTVTRVEVARRGALLLVDVAGESFLWNQVRRMVEAARRVAAGELPRSAIADALAAAKPADLGTAPPQPLVLLDVVYDGLAFTAGDARLLDPLRRRDEELELRRAVLGAMLG